MAGIATSKVTGICWTIIGSELAPIRETAVSTCSQVGDVIVNTGSMAALGG